MQSKKKSSIIFLSLAVALGLVGMGATVTNAINPGKFDFIEAHNKIGKSKAGLLNYKKGKTTKLAELGNQVNDSDGIFVTVTFSKPLNENQVAKIVNDYQIKVDLLIGRAVEQNGIRASFGIQPTPGSLIDKEMLKQLLTGKNTQFKGFIELVADVPNKNLQALANDKLVFLVDPSADESQAPNPKKDSMPGIFWDLEEYNMVAQ